MLIKDIAKRAAAPLFGYLVTTYQTDKPGVFQHLSIGDDPYNFRPMYKGFPVFQNTVGTLRIRDPHLVASPDRSDFWIIGTDLDVYTKSPAEAQSHGSRSIVVSHSKDLVNWEPTYLLPIETSQAGFLWAPTAVWSEEQKAYVIVWASNMYQASDPQHKKGGGKPSYMRFAFTKDFKTLHGGPWKYVEMPYKAIRDPEFLLSPNGQILKFATDVTDNNTYGYARKSLLNGGWGVGPLVVKGGSGPAAFYNNSDQNKIHLWIDYWTEKHNTTGYEPYEAHFDNKKDAFKVKFYKSAKLISPVGIRHGSVTPLTRAEYDRLNVAHFKD